MCEVGAIFDQWQERGPLPLFKRRFKEGHYIKKQLRDNYYVRSLGGADAWHAPEGSLGRHHLLAAARTLARFDVVMTVANIKNDAPAQMGRVGLPNFQWGHAYSRGRVENLQRAKQQAWMRTSGRASCQVPPTNVQVGSLVEACAWDAVLYEFARLLAVRRNKACNNKTLL